MYVIELVQAMLIAHDMFATFGYGFGDMDALTRVNLNGLTIPIMGALGAQSLCYPFPITYQEISCRCRAGLLCIPNPHFVEVTNRPGIHHLCSLLRSFDSVAFWLIYLQLSSTNSVASIITSIYAFQAGTVTKLNTRKMYIVVGVCSDWTSQVHWLNHAQISCGATALCDIVIATCMTYYASSFSLSVIFIHVDAIL